MSEPGPTKDNRRVHPRKDARPRVRVTCRKGSLDLGANLAVSLLDVSEAGIRLIVKAALDVGQEVFVGLEGPLHRRPVTREGKVVWVVPSLKGQYCVGIRLVKYLKFDDIRLLT